jgi:hypothetical protein
LCPLGSARDDLSDVSLVLQAVWSIADELSRVRVDEACWGGIPATVAADVLANQHFNTVARPLPLVARTDAMWLHGWGETVKPRLRAKAGGSPAELFAAATGCELEDFHGVALHLWVQAQQRRYLRYPAEFFRRLGIPTAAVDRFLAATSVTLDELRADAAGRDPIAEPWDFNHLRRRPLVRLPDGSVQVTRLGFVLARAFGQAPEFDVREHLHRLDGASTAAMTSGGREQAFRSALDLQFEHAVGAVLHRVFPARGRLRRLYTEREMGKAWRSRGQTPSVCDWAVDCGRTWLLFDATNRRLIQGVASGLAGPATLDDEVKKVLADKKANQIASTIRLLSEQMTQLTDNNVLPGIRFLPLIVIPEDGLPWNSAVHQRVQEILRDSGRLRETRVEPLGVITLDDLGLIELATEQGHDVARLLSRWRREAPEMPLQNFLHSVGRVLGRPQWETAVFDRRVDELLDRMTRHNETLASA